MCVENEEVGIKTDVFCRRRTDTAFGRVNCAHGDQTYRAPTAEEIYAGDAEVWGEYFDENGRPLDGERGGEVVCKWYLPTPGHINA